MDFMKRISIASLSVLCAATFALPGIAQAKIIELGQVDNADKPSCPGDPCRAMTRTTGYQIRSDARKGPFVAPSNGRVVAYTIALGKPNRTQVKFFNENYGGTARARISVLHYYRRLRYKVMAQSAIGRLQPYFGRTTQFPLHQTLPMKKGEVLALTTPTWLPVLALNLDAVNSWRASRQLGHCGDKDPSDFAIQTAIEVIKGPLTQFHCYNNAARLTYTATFIPTPKPPKK
jgi:hypothetical protein